MLPWFLVLVVFLSVAELGFATTLVVAKFSDGVVIGSDSRTSSGAYVASRFTDKVEQVSPGVFLCRSGSAADTQHITSLVTAKLSAYQRQYASKPTTRMAAYVTSGLCYNLGSDIQASMICAGWDRAKGGEVYAVNQGGAIFEQDFALSGSGSTYIIGYCDATFTDNMGKDECIAAVSKALELAMLRDTASGGVARLRIIDASGVKHRVLDPPEELRLASPPTSNSQPEMELSE